MPIYAYRCTTCGHAQDVLQKISDPLLSVCPACGAATYAKQVTAAGFQLKGSGWYVTDFRGDNKSKKPAEGEKSGGEKASEGDGGAAKADGNGADKGAGKDAGGAGKDAGKDTGKGAGKGTEVPAAASAPAPAAPASSSSSPPSGKSGD